MKIKLTKLKELPDAKHPGNIPEGYELTGTLPNELFVVPMIGKRFNIGGTNLGYWSTSVVKEVMVNDDEFVFRTYNSIYRYQIIDENELDITIDLYEFRKARR